MTTRRDLLKGSGLALGAGLALPAWTRPAPAQDADQAALLQPGPLADVWLGPADAKCTIIEYAALTCTHCAAFHRETWPSLKERYIDTGKVRFALRGYLLNALDTAGFMLAHYKGDAQYYPITDLLFEQQRVWAFAPKPVEVLEQILRQAGYTRASFEACLKDEALYGEVGAVSQRAHDVFQVNSTPTFFINGRRLDGAVPLSEMERVIKPLLGA